jgi:hypothetical protein
MDENARLAQRWELRSVLSLRKLLKNLVVRHVARR